MLREALNNLADAVERYEFYGDKDNKVAVQQILDAMNTSDRIFRDAILENEGAIASYIKEALRTKVSEALAAANTEIFKVTNMFAIRSLHPMHGQVGIMPCRTPAGNNFVDDSIAERAARIAKYYGVHKRSIPPLPEWTADSMKGGVSP